MSHLQIHQPDIPPSARSVDRSGTTVSAGSILRSAAQRITAPLIVSVLIVLPLLSSCSPESTGPEPVSSAVTLPPGMAAEAFSAQLTKWYGGRSAAISVTYDHGLRWFTPDEALVRRIIAEDAFPMDFDFTNSDLYDWTRRREFYLDSLIPGGIGVFGHGFEHINSDDLSPDSAYANFVHCYEDMVASGITPISYAYPGGACYAESTRNALARTKFLCGRKFTTTDHADPWICPGDILEPRDWYRLPSLVMWNDDDPKTIHSTAELVPFLDGLVDRRAWMIMTYHEIKDGPGGTYRVEDFRRDIRAIRERDIWAASMNDVTLYLRERRAARLQIEPIRDREGLITELLIVVSDGLPNDLYDHPLTADLHLPKRLAGVELGLFGQIDPSDPVAVIIPDTNGDALLEISPDEQSYLLHPLPIASQ